VTKYLHLQAQGVPVGTKVNAGQPIGKVGNTGNSRGAHLHFGMQDAKGNYINPEPFLK
jgi:murein DD-endopeptidase MepM/ murein hydrolase activator NlpD